MGISIGTEATGLRIPSGGSLAIYHEKLGDSFNTLKVDEARRLRGEGVHKLPIGARIRGHIVNLHFEPAILGYIGVPHLDVNLAALFGERLDWVVRKSHELLKDGWKDRNGFLNQGPVPGYSHAFNNSGEPWGEDWCKARVVKTLRMIDNWDLAKVNWQRIEQVYPPAESITYDPQLDAYEPPGLR